ncbi:MAG: methyltransferase domain-containing protein [Desulfobacteraceae bacterium]|jgi:2-polyprenyl-6-hydroxyphenyl methylase/3-demethylubiquinone-9 3-methyltransferase
MNNKWQFAGQILKAYSGSSWKVRIFVFIRYLVCPWQKLVGLLIPMIKDGKLLDIGCGHGLLLHLLQIANNTQFCVGMDHDVDKVAIARKSFSNNPQITIQDNSEPIPFSQKFDCISLMDVLYAVNPEDWPQIWNLIKKQLKPDGILVIKETVNQPKLKYWICLLQEILATKILKYTKGQFPFLPSAEYYLKELNRSGFEIVKHQRIDQGYLWPHYLFIARCKDFKKIDSFEKQAR